MTMSRFASRLCAACVLFLLSATALHAQTPPTASTSVPRVIRVNGVMPLATGSPAPVEIVTFAIYADETGGQPVWQETQNVVVSSDGQYTALLGSTMSDGLPLDVFTSQDRRWLEVHVERSGEPNSPRIMLASVPYALRASDADTLVGKPASAYRLPEPVSSVQPSGERSKSSTKSARPFTTMSATQSWIPLATDNAGGLGNSQMFQLGTGSFSRIGLGTTAPQDYFHISFDDAFGAFTGLAVQNRNGGPNASSGMLFFDQNGALAQFQGFSNATHEYRINNIAPGGSINFLIGNSSKFLVANNGTIGIGVPTGTAKLTMKANPPFAATGTASIAAGSATLTGVGTRFLTELNVGDRIMIGGRLVAVFNILSDTNAFVSAQAVAIPPSPMTVQPGMLRVQTSSGDLAFQVNDAGDVAIGGSLGVTSAPVRVFITDANRFSGTSTPAGAGNVQIHTTTPQAADVGGVLALGGRVGSSGQFRSFGGIRGAKENSIDVEPSGYVGLYTNDSSSTFAERMRVTSTGLVGIGTKTPTRELEVNGGVRLNTVAVKPTCDATVRGTFWVTQGAAGVKDSVEVCAKDASDAFAWRGLF